jgi:hypothetical protein
MLLQILLNSLTQVNGEIFNIKRTPESCPYNSHPFMQKLKVKQIWQPDGISGQPCPIAQKEIKHLMQECVTQ